MVCEMTRIYTASPLPLTKDSWERDITVLYRGFAALGHEAACVRLQSTDGSDFSGVLQVSMNEMESTEWWRTQGCDLVVTNTWAMPGLNKLVAAVKSSGAKILVRMDSHGYNSPWCGFWPYLRVNFYSFRQNHSSTLAAIKAFSKSLLYAIPHLYDRKMLEHLSLADGIGIESQGAYNIFADLLRSYNRPDLLEKLHVIHHPVIPEIENMDVPGREERDNCIVAVGRWNSPQKDTPLLIKTLAKSLASAPTWRVDIYGAGVPELQKLVARYADNVKERIHIHGPKPHEEILQAYQRSKICLFTSRFESGPIAGEEALCLGCSLVGPPDVPSMHDLCAPQFGNLPASRKPSDISRAVHTEISQWESGNRDPKAISINASAIYSARAVCKNILTVFDELKSLT